MKLFIVNLLYNKKKKLHSVFSQPFVEYALLLVEFWLSCWFYAKYTPKKSIPPPAIFVVFTQLLVEKSNKLYKIYGKRRLAVYHSERI